MSCTFDLHPMREKAERRLREGVFPARVAVWVNAQSPNLRPISDSTMRSHRNNCMGMGKMRLETKPLLKTGPKPEDIQDPPPAPPSAPELASKSLGHAVTEADIDQRLLTKFYDSIDALTADKVAEVMIERAKAEQKRVVPVAKTPKDVPDDDPARTLSAKIGMVMGARPSRTSSRIKRSA